MRSIASCYNEHAVKVSDSYCSGPSSRPRTAAQNLAPSVRIAVTCIYRSTLSNQKHLFITVTWHARGFAVSVDHGGGSQNPRRQFRKLKGAEAFDSSSGTKMEVHWDLTSAQYGAGPEPARGSFYLLVKADSEPTLALGNSDDSEGRIAAGKGKAKALLVSRSEHFSGSAAYATKAQFSGVVGAPAHDIVIKCSRESGRRRSDPVLSVWVDQRKVVQVERLVWNFRGNQTIFVDGGLVDMMWDVHDWFFNPASGYAVFMFRTRSELASRLWLQEEKLNMMNMGNSSKDQQERVEFSLLIYATCKNPPDDSLSSSSSSSFF